MRYEGKYMLCEWKDLADVIWLTRTNSYLHIFHLAQPTNFPPKSYSVRVCAGEVWIVCSNAQHIIKMHNTKIIPFFFVSYLLNMAFPTLPLSLSLYLYICIYIFMEQKAGARPSCLFVSILLSSSLIITIQCLSCTRYVLY